jgi:hypothetical protein
VHSHSHQTFLLLQTQVIAAAAAGVAAGGLPPKDAKVEAENAAQLSVALVENAIVILMLVEDHLRLQSKLSSASSVVDSSSPPLSLVSPLNNHSSSPASIGTDSLEALGDRRSSDSGGLPLDVCIFFPFCLVALVIATGSRRAMNFMLYFSGCFVCASIFFSVNRI